MNTRAVVLLLTLTHAAAAFASDLAGLWAGRRHFTPVARGTLLIEGDRAQIAGREARVTMAGGTVTFSLPTGEGSFRGTLSGNRILGHWTQPDAVALGGTFATPVTLEKQRDGRWIGNVQPLDDPMTMLLPVRADLSTFIVNPERNYGRFRSVSRLVRDGTRITLLGKDDQVVLEGRYDPERDVITIFNWRGGTYDLHRATPADEALFYARGKTTAPYVYRKPSVRDDGWRVASVDEVGIDRAAIESFVNYLTSVQTDTLDAVRLHAFLVARRGKLVVEEYFRGTNPDVPHETRSASKSLMSVLAGAAAQRGYPVRASMPVYETMYGQAAAEQVEPRKRAITLEHLLTMSAGLDCDDNDDSSPGREDTMNEQTAQPDYYRFMLDLKMIRDPGAKAVYCSGLPHLAGGVVEKATGRWLPDLFRELVATPLQFRTYGLRLTPTGGAYMGGGTRVLPRDFLKMGQLMLDEGRWNGRQIVSREWVARASAPLYDVEDYKLRYGYLFWVVDYPWNDRTVRAYFASGNGGQIIMTIPTLDLVLGFFGENYNDAGGGVARREYVAKWVLPAVR